MATHVSHVYPKNQATRDCSGEAPRNAKHCPGHFATAPEQPPANDLDLSAVQVAPVGFLDGGLLAPAPLVESHHRHPCGLLECRCSVGVNYHDVSRTNDSDARMK